MSYTYVFKLGTTEEGMVNVEAASALKCPPHPHTLIQGAERYIAGTGKAYYDGYPQATWFFRYLRVAAWEWLMDFFSIYEYADVYITTKDANEDYKTYTAIMHRPVLGQSASRGHYGYYNVELVFTHLQAV